MRKRERVYVCVFVHGYVYLCLSFCLSACVSVCLPTSVPVSAVSSSVCLRQGEKERQIEERCQSLNSVDSSCFCDGLDIYGRDRDLEPPPPPPPPQPKKKVDIQVRLENYIEEKYSSCAELKITDM